MPGMESLTRILLVEADDATRDIMEAAAAPLAEVESHRSFETARGRLCCAPFDLIVTNVRLGAYNGLHLIYLTSPDRGARAIVYSDEHDAGLARQVQQAGAFYEVGAGVPGTLAAYAKGALPGRDRRDPAIPDRREPFRGGRRSSDSIPIQAKRRGHTSGA
jgi:DNA-binding NtrC family response regulator